MKSFFEKNPDGGWSYFNAAMIWNIWDGNLEVFTIAGLLLGYLVINRKIHPTWWGVGAIALVTKPQVGLGLIIFFTFQIWKDHGFRKLIPAGFVSILILIITSIIWPGWILRWIHNSISISYGWWNGSIFPWGLAAWIPALLPVSMTKVQRMRLVSAATLLGSPYMTLYHSSTLIVQHNSPLALIFSFAVVGFGLLFTDNWMRVAWLFPTALICLDMISLFRDKFRQESVEVKNIYNQT